MLAQVIKDATRDFGMKIQNDIEAGDAARIIHICLE